MRPEQLQQLQEFVNSNLGWWIGAVVACFLGSLLVLKIRNWYHDGDGPADSKDQFLQRLRDSHREGQISDEEYRSIKSRFFSEDR